MRHVRHRLRQKRRGGRDHRIALDLAMPRQRAEPQASVRALDEFQAVQMGDVDQHGRGEEAHVEGRDEALPAGDRYRVIAMLDEALERLVKVSGAGEGKSRRFHLVWFLLSGSCSV